MYTVRRPFRYDGKDYKPGDTWEPSGARADESLIAHFVLRADDTAKQPNRRTARATQPKQLRQS